MAKKPERPCFVQEVPLLTNPRESMILNQRLQVVGMLANVGLDELRTRGDKMRADPRWVAARLIKDDKEKSRAYRDLKYEYGLQAKLVPTLVFNHWRASKWMTEVVDSRAALALGSEILQNVNEWLYARAERPRMRPTKERAVAWGVSGGAGLRLDPTGELLLWAGPQSHRRKKLVLKLDWRSVSAPRREYLSGLRVIRSGVRRERVRGQTRYVALICYEGLPYRNEQYLEALAKRSQRLVAFDLNVASVAIVSRDDSELIKLSEELLAEQGKLAALERRRKRALDRSRRASNPDAYDERGRHIKGKHAKELSQRGRRRQDRLNSVKRKERESRRQQEAIVAKQVALAGSSAAFEKTNKSSWMAGLKGLGKKMGFTAPGAVEAAIKRELKLFCQGVAAELPISLSLSQLCLCGHKEKKELGPGYRFHHCSHCGLGPLQRDLFSAFLALLCAEEGITDLPTLLKFMGEGPFNTDEVRVLAERLCASSRRAPHSDSLSPSLEELARKGNGQTPSRGPVELVQATAERNGRRPARDRDGPKRPVQTVP